VEREKAQAFNLWGLLPHSHLAPRPCWVQLHYPQASALSSLRIIFHIKIVFKIVSTVLASSEDLQFTSSVTHKMHIVNKGTISSLISQILGYATQTIPYIIIIWFC